MRIAFEARFALMSCPSYATLMLSLSRRVADARQLFQILDCGFDWIRFGFVTGARLVSLLSKPLLWLSLEIKPNTCEAKIPVNSALLGVCFRCLSKVELCIFGVLVRSTLVCVGAPVAAALVMLHTL